MRLSTQLNSGPHSLSSFFSSFFPSHMPLAIDLVRSKAAISFSSLSKILLTAHFSFEACTHFFLSLCTCHTSLNTFCHAAPSAATMFSLLLRCMISYLILVQLGSHHLWSGSTLTFLWLLGEMEKKSVGGKEKGKQKNGMWIGKQLQLLQTAGLFCCTEGLFLIECDLISNTEFPSSPFGAAVTRSLARIRERQTVKLIPSQSSSLIPTLDKWGSHLEVSWERQVHSREICVMATPVFSVLEEVLGFVFLHPPWTPLIT